jgi:hypothetical protein
MFQAANRWPLFPGSHFVGRIAGEERSDTYILHQIRGKGWNLSVLSEYNQYGYRKIDRQDKIKDKNRRLK